MRKLALKNSNTSKIGTFKNILLDLSIKTLDDLVSGQVSGIEPIPEALATIRLKNIGKKKLKGQTLTNKWFSL